MNYDLGVSNVIITLNDIWNCTENYTMCQKHKDDFMKTFIIYYFYFSGKLPAAMQTAGVGTHLHFGLFILVAIHGAFCLKKQTVILLWKNISTLLLKKITKNNTTYLHNVLKMEKIVQWKKMGRTGGKINNYPQKQKSTFKKFFPFEPWSCTFFSDFSPLWRHTCIYLVVVFFTLSFV